MSNGQNRLHGRSLIHLTYAMSSVAHFIISGQERHNIDQKRQVTMPPHALSVGRVYRNSRACCSYADDRPSTHRHQDQPAGSACRRCTAANKKRPTFAAHEIGGRLSIWRCWRRTPPPSFKTQVGVSFSAAYLLRIKRASSGIACQSLVVCREKGMLRRSQK